MHVEVLVEQMLMQMVFVTTKTIASGLTTLVVFAMAQVPSMNAVVGKFPMVSATATGMNWTL